MKEHTTALLHQMQDFETSGELDLARLERSLGLRAEPAGEGRYRIVGGEHDHWVDLYTAAYPRCDCGDYLWRDLVCKHILAALMREGNEQVIQAVGSLFAALKSAA
jgi:hypothetical protein